MSGIPPLGAGDHITENVGEASDSTFEFGEKKEASAPATSTGLGEPHTPNTPHLPADLWNTIGGELFPQDALRLAATSHTSDRALRSGGLRKTLVAAEEARDAMQDLGPASLDPKRLGRTVVKLAPHFPSLEEGKADALVGRVVDSSDEFQKALAVGGTAGSWSKLTSDQQEKILSAAEKIEESLNKSQALGKLGTYALADMTKNQQDRWATAVAGLSEQVREYVILRTTADNLLPSAKEILLDPEDYNQRRRLAILNHLGAG